MSEYLSIYLYFGLVALITVVILLLSAMIPSNTSSPAKFLPYESGIRTETHLLRERFPLRHYLIGLLFLVFDIEVIFLYPWAVVSKQVGPFAFYEMLVFLTAMMVGFCYIWRKKGLQWE